MGARMRRCLLAAGLLLGLVQATVAQQARPGDREEDLGALLDLGDAGAEQAAQFNGHVDLGAAYTWPDDGHWSRLRTRLELGLSGRLGARSRYKLSVRADADGAFDLEDAHYPRAVRRDQRAELSVREAYVDFGADDWEFRAGRQHVVWGEMVGLFFADVVSARDLREFYLPEFESLRIPQWALRAERFGSASHLELLWLPFPSQDEVGEPGAEFYPWPLPSGTRVHARKPSATLSNTHWGVRLSSLVAGWDLAAFHYQSRDVSPTLYALDGGSRFELRYDRLRQTGVTAARDMGSFVLKGEAVHTRGRSFATRDPAAPHGLQASSTLDYVLGVDIPLQDVWRINLQYYARVFLDHQRLMPNDRQERGVTVLLNRKFGDALEAELLYVGGLNRSDYMLRPKLIWQFAPDWRMVAGVDVFGGRRDGIFGRFGDRDRVYLELRRWF